MSFSNILASEESYLQNQPSVCKMNPNAPPQSVPMQYQYQPQPPAVVQVPGPTIVIQNQPPASDTLFKKDLFSCCDHAGLCLCVSFVPFAAPYISNKVAETVGEGFCCHGFCACFCDPLSARVRIRGMLRAKYNIKGDCFSDTMAHMFCGPCAIVQEVAELAERGVAPDMPCMSRQ